MSFSSVGSKETKVFELQGQVGLSESVTETVLQNVAEISCDSSIFPIYDLLILERFDKAVPLLRSAMSTLLDLEHEKVEEYLYKLIESHYYLHRMAVPVLIRGMKIRDETKKDLIRKGILDSIALVASGSIKSVLTENIFDTQSLIDIASYLSKHVYTSVRSFVVDIAALLGDIDILRRYVLASERWRVRIRAAYLVDKFSEKLQNEIFKVLKEDHIEEIRIVLGQSLKSINYIQLLDDPSEQVRAAYLKNIIDKIDDDAVFRKLARDSSWEVKKLMLNLQGKWLHSVTIPLIMNSRFNVQWRIRYETLDLIEEKLGEEDVVRPLFEFILGGVQDKVAEIRNKAGSLLVKIVKMYPWALEYCDSIEKIVSSDNYLHRISILPAAVLIERLTGLKIASKLRDDPVENVRSYYAEFTSTNNSEIFSLPSEPNSS